MYLYCYFICKCICDLLSIIETPATVVTSDMMTLKSNGDDLTFTVLGDWGKDGSKQRAVASGLGIWSEINKAQFTAAIG